MPADAASAKAPPEPVTVIRGHAAEVQCLGVSPSRRSVLKASQVVAIASSPYATRRDSAFLDAAIIELLVDASPDFALKVRTSCFACGVLCLRAAVLTPRARRTRRARPWRTWRRWRPARSCRRARACVAPFRRVFDAHSIAFP